MGTYTRHIIRFTDPGLETEENLHVLARAVADNSYIDHMHRYHNVLNDYNWNSGDGAKWYEAEEDIIQISKAVPDWEIELIGMREDYEYDMRHSIDEWTGEPQDYHPWSLWHMVVKNGKVVTEHEPFSDEQFVYDNFQPGELLIFDEEE